MQRTGWTRVDFIILFTIAITATGLLLPGCQQRVRTFAKGTQTLNNLKILALANHNYNDVYKKLPPAEGGSVQIDGVKYTEDTTCIFLVGPYMENNSNTLINPADTSFTGNQSAWTSGRCYTSLAANLYVFSDPTRGIAGTNEPRSLNAIHDGTSNTIMAATTMAQCGGNHIFIQRSTVQPFFGAAQSAGWQVAPTAATCNATTGMMAVSYNAAEFQVALCDASCRNMTTNAIWAQALTPMGGEKFDWE